MSHLTPEQLNAHLDGASAGAERAAAERHLAECAECRAALADLAALDASLGGVLEHDPGEAYFASFANRVEQRLRAEGVRGAQSRGAEESEHRWMDWLRSPRRLAWLGAAAAVIGGAAIVLVTSREDRMSALDESRVAKNLRSNESAPSAAPEPVALQSPEAAGSVAKAKSAAEQGAAGGTLARSSTAQGAAGARQDEGAPATGKIDQPAAPAEEHGSARLESRELGGAMTEEGRAKKTELRADDKAMRAPVLEDAERRADAAKPSLPAAPERLIRVSKDANGNWVQEKQPTPVAGFAAPPAASAPAVPGEPMHVRKENAATPMSGELKQEAMRSAPGVTTESQVVGDQLAPGEIELCGSVFDSGQRPVVGASVTLVKLGRVGFTGADGRFCMGAPAGDYELSVSAVGFAPRRVQIHVGGELANVQVPLDAISVLGDGGKLAKGGAARGGLALFGGKPGAMTLDNAGADPFAGLPDSTRIAARDAQRLSAAASAAKNATAHELAAGRWEHVLAAAPSAGPAAGSARYRIAEERFGAWQASPNATRASAAKRALDAYLVTAPAGAQRDRATRWRAALPR